MFLSNWINQHIRPSRGHPRSLMPAVRAHPVDHPADSTAWAIAEPDPAARTNQPPPTSQARPPGQATPSAPPVMLGYARLGQLRMSPDQVIAMFNDYARRNGFWLAEVFIEQDSTTPAAFDSLLKAAKQRAARVVAVPSVDHLAVLGGAPLNHMLERITGAQLHEMDRAPAPTGQV
jgi:hypothetical protein